MSNSIKHLLLAISLLLFTADLNSIFVEGIEIQVNDETKIKKTSSAFSESNKFKIDTAKLIIYISKPLLTFPIDVLLKSDECYKCAYYVADRILPGQHELEMFLDTKWQTSLQLSAVNLNCSATFRYHFGEYGEYSVNFTQSLNLNFDDCLVSSIIVVKHPQNNIIPILVAAALLVILAFLHGIVRFLYDAFSKAKSRSTSGRMVQRFNIEDGSCSLENTIQRKRKRLGSIDTFRGLCLIVMIFVNYGGGKYWYFEHATWNGLTVADLVFPWFMFIMGVNITLSVDSLVRKNIPRREVAYKVIRRTLILFALGLTAININTTWTGFRVPGVLQRFAIAYLFGFAIQWGFHKSAAKLKAEASNDERKKWWYVLRDVLLYWPQWLIVLLLEALWLFLTFILPVPGCPTGYLGPGGLADNGKFSNSNCIGGAAGYIDRRMFGENHIYGFPTPKAVFYPTSGSERVPFDPEGVLGSINGCIIVFLGSQMGKIFLYYERPESRVVRWLVWGLMLGVISILLCQASANGGWIPVNKNLWTITFVTTLSCFAFFLMIVIYFLVDVKKLWSGSPFDFVGMNSIFLYVAHQTFSYYIPFSWGADEYSTHAEWLAMNMLGVFYWVLIAYYCYRIKFFVKI